MKVVGTKESLIWTRAIQQLLETLEKIEKGQKGANPREILAIRQVCTYIVFLEKVVRKMAKSKEDFSAITYNRCSRTSIRRAFINNRFWAENEPIINRSKSLGWKEITVFGTHFFWFPKFDRSNFTGTDYQTILQEKFLINRCSHTLDITEGKIMLNDNWSLPKWDSSFGKPLVKGWYTTKTQHLKEVVSVMQVVRQRSDLANWCSFIKMYGNVDGNSYFGRNVKELQRCNSQNETVAGCGFDKTLLWTMPSSLGGSVPPLWQALKVLGTCFYGDFLWADPERKLTFIFLSTAFR